MVEMSVKFFTKAKLIQIVTTYLKTVLVVVFILFQSLLCLGQTIHTIHSEMDFADGVIMDTQWDTKLAPKLNWGILLLD